MAQDIFERVSDNIRATSNDPAKPLEQRLFDEAELVLPESLPPDQKRTLVVELSALLPTLQQDPSPAVNLLLRLVRDDCYSDILSLGSVPFVDGLAVGEHLVPFNKLILALLQKATESASDAASVAGMLDTVLALIKLWLCTSDAGVASQASQVLVDLLRVDREIRTDPDAHLPRGGQGLVWKRIFGDRDVYRTFYEACSLNGSSSLKLSRAQRTLAQARLMEWLPIVASMDWDAISRSHHSDVEADYKVQGGLLDFAALHMVDTADDVLMHRCLIDFFSAILRATEPVERLLGAVTNSVGLTYLVGKGIHARTAALYVQRPAAQLDPLETVFLYGPAANYVATYASSYPEHFLVSQMPSQVIERLDVALSLSPARWAHADSPKHDLHVLASLPRRTLLVPPATTGPRASSISLLPSKATNSDVLDTLATIFHGPVRDDVYQPGSTLHTNDPVKMKEAAEARALYYHYLSHNPRFWSDITAHADTVALADLALSAVNCLVAVITANWSGDDDLATLSVNIAMPESGHLAILSPPALEYTLPYLLKPPQTFANLVGGRGDSESSAYRIASAKFDALRAFQNRLAQQVGKTPGEGYEDILATINKRLAEGPLSREGEVGGRVGTLEL